MEQHVLPLDHVYGHVSETHAVLHEVGDGVHRLDHLVHQQELLGVLQVPLGQVHVGARVDGSALRRNGRDEAEWTGTELSTEQDLKIHDWKPPLVGSVLVCT